MTDETTEPLELEWAVDQARFQQVRSDLKAALVVQNARTAKRFDPIGRRRSPQLERRLLLIALIACLLGLLLSALMLAVKLPGGGELGREVASIALFSALGGLSLFAWRARQALVDGVDRSLDRLGARLLRRVEPLLPALARYRLEGSRCEGTWRRDEVVLRRWTRDLSRLGYGLVGPAAVVLFKRRTSLTPKVILFAAAEAREPLLGRLRAAGLALEELGPHLLPPATVERRLA